MKSRAFMTVETSLIMPLVMTVVISLFFIMFYIYDYVIVSDASLQGVTEYAFVSGLGDVNAEREIEERVNEHIKEMLVLNDNTTVDASINMLDVKVETQTDIRIPDMGNSLTDYTHIKVTRSLPRITGGGILRDVRRVIGIKRYSDKIKEDYFNGDNIQKRSQSELPYSESGGYAELPDSNAHGE